VGRRLILSPREDSDRVTSGSRFYGKYRGTVVGSIDPLMQGRIQAAVPDVLGDAVSSWALPCFPFAGVQAGMYAVPQPGTGVWIEFEQGDPDRPIWAGCWYASASEVPALALAQAPVVVLQTPAENAIMISDDGGPAGGILLRAGGGAMISVGAAGIVISSGQGATITLSGPTVQVNDSALVVT
jgi:uncharacterized protein involved in type VI secretion and phage assembly